MISHTISFSFAHFATSYHHPHQPPSTSPLLYFCLVADLLSLSRSLFCLCTSFLSPIPLPLTHTTFSVCTIHHICWLVFQYSVYVVHAMCITITLCVCVCICVYSRCYCRRLLSLSPLLLLVLLLWLLLLLSPSSFIWMSERARSWRSFSWNQFWCIGFKIVSIRHDLKAIFTFFSRFCAMRIRFTCASPIVYTHTLTRARTRTSSPTNFTRGWKDRAREHGTRGKKMSGSFVSAIQFRW